MHMKTAGQLALATFLGIVIGAAASEVTRAEKPSVSRTELINADLADLKDKVAHMYIVELAPGVMTPRHRHPGHYFNYVLEGAGVMEEDGKPARQLGPGVSYYIHSSPEMPAPWHSVWNTDTARPMKTLVVLINDKGQPGTEFDK